MQHDFRHTPRAARRIDPPRSANDLAQATQPF